MRPRTWIPLLLGLPCLGWLLAGVLTYGLFLGYWQGAYPGQARVLCRMDKAQAWRVARWGPFGLTAVLGTMIQDHEEWHGLQWTCQEDTSAS